jgi:hypothetical protein
MVIIAIATVGRVMSFEILKEMHVVVEILKAIFFSKLLNQKKIVFYSKFLYDIKHKNIMKMDRNFL